MGEDEDKQWGSVFERQWAGTIVLWRDKSCGVSKIEWEGMHEEREWMYLHGIPCIPHRPCRSISSDQERLATRFLWAAPQCILQRKMRSCRIPHTDIRMSPILIEDGDGVGRQYASDQTVGRAYNCSTDAVVRPG